MSGFWWTHCTRRVFAPGNGLEFQLGSGREHPPRDMSSSKTGHCYGGIDDIVAANQFNLI
eukprot:gene26733-biopygen17254